MPLSALSRRECMMMPLAAAAGARRPNVLLILTDDQGYGDLSLHGNPHLKTPNLDKLAREGVEMTRFYVSPVCAPTRASLLTGRYNVRCGVHGVTRGMETMAPDEITIAEALRPAGYKTALYGKWHLGEHYPYVPHAQGFEEFIGFRTGHWMNYHDAPLERNGKPLATRGYITDALTDQAIGFIERNRRQPFFLYLAYNVPHSPYQVPRRYYDPFVQAGLAPEVAAVYGMIVNLDENIGRLMGALDRLNLARDTIVIFLSDNGPAGVRYNCGLRGRKASVYEGGLRVPFFIRWPGKLPAGKRVDTMAAHIDIYPTLLELCGVSAPKGPRVDGLSLRPLLYGSGSWPDRILFTHRETQQNPAEMWTGSARTQRFSLINGKELYELTNDPGEQTNVASKYPEEFRRLRAAYERWFQEAIAERGFRRYPIPVGYAEENPVVLPAPQAYFSGELRYHGGPGYAHDWITGWTNVQDSVWWEIDVVRQGRYVVELRYLCPAGDVGAKIGVSAAGAKLSATVTEATPVERKPNPSVIPNDDRYPEMHWGTLRLGQITLKEGKTRLTIQPQSKPGARVMDLKEVELRRID